MWVSLSYSGFNAAVYVAGEARDAATNVPRAMVLATVLVMVLYLALNAVFVYAPASAAIIGKRDVAAHAAAVLGGQWLELGVRAIIALALVSSVSAMVLSGPRVYAQMAHDGVLPRVLQMHGDVPHAAVALQVVLACVIILLAGLQELLSYLGFILSISAAATVASLFVLHRAAQHTLQTRSLVLRPCLAIHSYRLPLLCVLSVSPAWPPSASLGIINWSGHHCHRAGAVRGVHS